MINLGRLSFENFKSFSDLYEVDFRKVDLFVLDGPNGFGKTTIFDAIEVCLTGRIGRVFSTDNKKKNTHFLKNILDKPTNIFLELVKDHETILVIHASIPKDTTVEQNKIRNHGIDINFLSKWPDDIRNISDLDYLVDFSLERILDNSNFKSTFDIFNYIQQEETFHFLKNKESERHDKISYLFGTSKEVNQKDHFIFIKGLLEKKKNNLTEELGVLYGEKKNLENQLGLNLNSNNVSDIHPSNKINKLVNNDNLISELNQHVENIGNLIWILNNKENFKILKFNFSINYIISNRKSELENVVKIGHLKDYNEFERIEKHIDWIEKLSNIIEIHESVLNVDNNVLELETINLFSKIHPILSEKYTIEIKNLKDLKGRVGTSQATINKIVTSRNSLKQHYEMHISSESSKISCPFCGDYKNTIVELWEEFDKQSQYFEELKDVNSIELSHLEKKLKESFFLECRSKSDYIVSKYKKYLDILPSLNEKLSLKDQWKSMEKLRTWFEEADIDIGNYICVKSSDLIGNSLTTKMNELVSFLRKLILPIGESKNYSDLYGVLKYYNLSENQGIIFDVDNNIIELADLEKDLLFLSYYDLKSKSEDLRRKTKEISDKESKLNAITSKFSELQSICSAYNISIKKYELSVAKQISIPFHVYSSKLLQTRPDGNGVFLQSAKNAQEVGFFRFVSNLTDDHDAWNTMSSGQLSGLILSFTLAMNKVYPSKFNTLLIDDPVQTMDEINLASFVQLLRNEFSDYQLVISTHERRTSSYFSYKYQHNNEVKILNLKQSRLNFL
ncbi:AAA family ATPase [Acinetobacter sp. A1-4-2]|uniref:AAA family ATPase n=1 Tax=Acinetobacter sp. A1-4-2 TaxID=3156489 RepID=A0AAU7SZN7_9GAMM